MLLGIKGYPDIYHLGPHYIRHVSGDDYNRLKFVGVPDGGFTDAESFRGWARTWGIDEGTWPL